MGRVALFNRRIDLADDDMYLPAFYYLINHVLWLLVIFGVYMLTQSDCIFKGDLQLYLCMLIIILLFTIPVELCVLILSLSGTVSNQGKRWLISPLCQFHLILSIVELAIQTYGMTVAFSPVRKNTNGYCDVNEIPPSIVWVHLVIIWGFIVAALWIFIVGLFMYVSKAKHITDMIHYQQVWKQRLEWVMSGLKSKLPGAEDVMGDVAAELADYFRDVEWAPSDFLVGLLLMEKDQAYKKQILQEKRRIYFVNKMRKQKQNQKESWLSSDSSSESTLLLPSQPAFQAGNNNTFDEPLDIALHPVWKSAKEYQPLLPASENSLSRPKSTIQKRYGYKAMTKDDISDILHFSSYAEVAYIKEDCEDLCKDNLLYFSEENGLFRSPFFIAVDPEYSSIIISIRGTYSAADWLVDLKIDLEPFYIQELGQDGLQWTHSGIHQTASNILKELRVNRILSKLLGQGSLYQNFNIVTTGHSLGAGVSALLAYMLRRDGFSHTRCYAYSPPSQLLTEEAAKIFEPFCVSVVTGDDFVCRLSRNSMQILKMDMTRLLTECNLPKYKLLGNFIGSSFCWFRNNEKKPERPRIQSSTYLSRFSRISQSFDSRNSFINNRRKSNSEHSKWSVWIKQSFSPILKKELEKGMNKLKDTIHKIGHLSVDGQNEEEESLLPHPPMFLPGRILYVEKCQLFHDEKDIDLPWTHSRHSVLNPPPSLPTSMKIIASQDNTSIKMDNSGNKDYNIDLESALPSQILDTKQGCFSYTPRWASREEFQQIYISSTMIKDHFPFSILSALAQIPSDRKLRFVTK